MFLQKLTVQNFRNIPLATLSFSGNRQFLVGGNGQGKTNLLEAAGFMTALRSFRVSDGRLLIRQGEAEAGIAWSLRHEQMGETEVTVRFDRSGKRLTCDGQPVGRLADHLGKFPAVVFSSQDIQLIRGSPALRRRWLDLTLAAMDSSYLQALQTYGRSLAERNALLKKGGGGSELTAFDKTLAPAAARLIALRTEGIVTLRADFAEAYRAISDQTDQVELIYEPDFAQALAEVFLAKLDSSRSRDLMFRSTMVGPHRDDLAFLLSGSPAKDFASEGQQRSIVLALRFSQLAWFRKKSGVQPLLLADDVLGELDPIRRERFWRNVAPGAQVIATGTVVPEAPGWEVFTVIGGAFSPGSSP